MSTTATVTRAQAEPITFFDLKCTKPGLTWSPNTWRIRLLLNYKGLPYHTTWLNYVDLARVLSSRGVPPPPPEDPRYTVPTIIDGARVITDSVAIADYIEETYPDRSTFGPGGRDAEAMRRYAKDIHKRVRGAMFFMVLPSTAEMLDEENREFYLRTRKAMTGVDLADMYTADTKAGLWEHLEKTMEEFSAELDEIPGPHSEGWLFGKDEPTYADFVLCSCFVWFKLMGPAGGWETLRKWNGGKWDRLYKSCEKYMSVV